MYPKCNTQTQTLIALSLLIANAGAATIHECRAYNGSTFYSSDYCSQHNAAGVINHSVPDGLPFEQQVQIVEVAKARSRQETESVQHAQRIASDQAQDKQRQCSQLERQIEATDGALRQPHSGQWGDHLNGERRKLMDQRFALRC